MDRTGMFLAKGLLSGTTDVDGIKQKGDLDLDELFVGDNEVSDLD